MIGGFNLNQNRKGVMKREQDADLHIRINRQVLLKLKDYSEHTNTSQSKLLRDFIVGLPRPRKFQESDRESYLIRELPVN